MDGDVVHCFVRSSRRARPEQSSAPQEEYKDLVAWWKELLGAWQPAAVKVSNRWVALSSHCPAITASCFLLHLNLVIT